MAKPIPLWYREQYQGIPFGNGIGKGCGLQLTPVGGAIRFTQPHEARELAKLLTEWADRETRARLNPLVAPIGEVTS